MPPRHMQATMLGKLLMDKAPAAPLGWIVGVLL